MDDARTNYFYQAAYERERYTSEQLLQFNMEK